MCEILSYRFCFDFFSEKRLKGQ